MNRDSIEEEELRTMFDRLDQEVDLLFQALEGTEGELEDEYGQKVARSQLESIGEIVEAMSQRVGAGEMISVTTPSQLEDDEQ